MRKQTDTMNNNILSDSNFGYFCEHGIDNVHKANDYYLS